MWKSLVEFLYINHVVKREEPRKYNYDGHWENIGTEQEEWVWKEHNPDFTEYYINVIEIDGGYMLTKSSRPLNDVIEWVECLSVKDEQRAIKLLTTFYERKGKVVLSLG